MKEQKLYRNNWISIYYGFRKPRFTFGPASYFDERAEVTFNPTLILSIIGLFFTGFSLWSLIFVPFLFTAYGVIYLHLPIYSGIDECETPEYGFYFYSVDGWIPTNFVICKGINTKHIELPWNLEWYRTSMLKCDGTWETEKYRLEKKDFWNDDIWKDKIKYDTYEYKYTLKNGEVQNRIAKVRTEEREWRPRWFMWTSLFSKVNRSINVDFSEEVGDRTGSWKGGCVGCGYTMKPGETPLQTLRRMERERKFR